MGDLERDTRVEGSDGRYRATLSGDWAIWGPNGGYLAVIAMRAAAREAKIARPASFTGHFLRVARFAAVDLEVEVVHAGRRAESLRVRMTQEGRVVLEALVRTAAEAPGLEHDVAVAPDVPPPESLRSADALRAEDAPESYPFWKNLEARPVWPERFREGPRARDPVWREWYRFRPRATFDDVFLDAGRSLLLIDTLSWPGAAQPHPNGGYQAPNLDVNVWFHRFDPAGEWLLVDHGCPVAAKGLMGTVGRVWGQDGALLASGGAQLLCVPVPPG
jgi:acyl-CoA thioesterase